MGGVVVDGFDLGKGGEVVGFRVEGGALVGGGRDVLDAHGVLDKPFVDGLCGMSHEDATAEVGFGEDVGEGGGMVEVKAVGGDGQHASEIGRMHCLGDSRSRCSKHEGKQWIGI